MVCSYWRSFKKVKVPFLWTDMPMPFVFHADCQFGDPIQTEDEMGQGENLRLPAPAGTAYCLDANPAGT